MNLVMYAPHNILLHLSLLHDVGPTTINTLLSSLPKDFNLEQLYTMLPSDFMEFGVLLKKAQKIVQGLAETKMLEDELRLLEKHTDIAITTILDANYPQYLKEITGAPIVLYTQGAPLTDNEKRIAVIGARKANAYGQQAIDAIVPALVNNGWVIVSGGALGADSMAHRATLAAGGKTIVVVGSGLSITYPSSHKKLYESIVANGGTIISIFPIAMPALAENFPARNRIISGLSKGCLVAQAARKSGASITAHYALEHGRDVFAIPGPLDDELSAGCHALIQQGAKLVTSADDILQEYGESPIIAVSEKKASKKAIAFAYPIENIIYQACAVSISTDDLLEISQLSLSDLHKHLFDLQISGHITQNFNGMWQQLR